MARIKFVVDGKPATVDADPSMPLLSRCAMISK
jgi:hypothetical protein